MFTPGPTPFIKIQLLSEKRNNILFDMTYLGKKHRDLGVLLAYPTTAYLLQWRLIGKYLILSFPLYVTRAIVLSFCNYVIFS